MNYNILCQKREQLAEMRRHLPKEALESFDKSFEIEYTHNSTAIEGNTLSLIQTKAVLEDGISIGGKTLHEIAIFCPMVLYYSFIWQGEIFTLFNG